jgi:hypothetical protein
MLKRNFILNAAMALLVPMFLLAACKSRKHRLGNREVATKPLVPDSAARFVDRFMLNRNSAAAIYFNGDAAYRDASQEATLEVEVQAEKDQYIWMNVKAMGFVNVARILIKPDSIRIIDLINKTYTSASYNYLRSFTSAPIGFVQLQNLLSGNALFDPQNGTISDTSTVPYTVTMDVGGVQQVAVYNNAYKAQSVALIEQARNQQMSVIYRDFIAIGNNAFPQQIEINIQGEKKLGCKFSLNNFAAEKKRDPQFVVPRSYKVQVY